MCTLQRYTVCLAAKQEMNRDVILDKLSVINLQLCLAKPLLVKIVAELKLGTKGYMQ